MRMRSCPGRNSLQGSANGSRSGTRIPTVSWMRSSFGKVSTLISLFVPRAEVPREDRREANVSSRMTHVFPILLTFIVATACATGVKAADWTNRTRGLLIGSLIGDALGGPFEFQPKDTWEKLPFPPKVWKPGERMTGEAIAALRSRVRLNPYGPLRPVPESYAHWLSNAAPGTITDDSRNKMVLLHCVERTLSEGRWPVSGEDFAREFVEWPRTAFLRARTDYKVISNEWLEEFRYSARWILGERDPRRALPPERMWNSLPTCCGQMMFPPLAAIYPGQADKAYLLAWNLGWVDNGFGRDMNATLVAALAMALTVEPDRKDPIQDWNRIA
ncbi:MAG: ADP-ribosylglycohydrolase family protein, partial [Verrucomicrobia bacterium]|nr:ADP-ribosylglycohydrolase family protein [Verrucomicrobiota bacterium]